MERFIKHTSEEQPAAASIEQQTHTSAHVEFFQRPEGVYEEISFLYEPMQAYKDDLVQIEVALEAKRVALKELEAKAASHAIVPAEEALRILRGDFHDKIVLLRETIGRLEVLHTVTQQRLMMLARQDQNERQILEHTATETEQ